MRFVIFFGYKNEIGAGEVICRTYLHMFDLFQVMHVLGFDPHAFAHFRDERKRRRDQVYAVRYILIYFFL